jgi:hypothetical protein
MGVSPSICSVKYESCFTHLGVLAVRLSTEVPLLSHNCWKQRVPHTVVRGQEERILFSALRKTKQQERNMKATRASIKRTR